MTWLWVGLVFKREGKDGRMVGVVPVLTCSVARKCLLLGVHVEQQVSDTVAVTELIVIPAKEEMNTNNQFEKKIHCSVN